MKDQYAGIPIYEYIEIKSKMYSIRNVYNHEKSVYKGHNSDIKYDEFKDTHSNEKVIRHNMRGIKSKHHKTYIYMKVMKHLCLILMISGIFLTME